jgi:hypothetical protein
MVFTSTLVDTLMQREFGEEYSGVVTYRQSLLLSAWFSSSMGMA